MEKAHRHAVSQRVPLSLCDSSHTVPLWPALTTECPLYVCFVWPQHWLRSRGSPVPWGRWFGVSRATLRRCCCSANPCPKTARSKWGSPAAAVAWRAPWERDMHVECTRRGAALAWAASTNLGKANHYRLYWRDGGCALQLLPKNSTVFSSRQQNKRTLEIKLKTA